MKGKSAKRRKQHGQQGYALVLVVFLLALAVIATATVAPNIIVNGRREKEEEMIWRGKQYVRGIRLFVRYYQMHGGVTRFPTSMDDLTQNKVGIRFMRQAYKDPVNTVDGSWRFIYVGPNGQLIGSLKSRPLGGNDSSGGGFGSLFGNSSQSSFGNSASGGSSFGNSSFGSSSFGSSSSFGNSSFGNSSFGNSQNAAAPGANANPGTTTGQNASQGTDANGSAGDSFFSQMSTPQPIGGSDNPTEVVGGNIIGVGSKVNQASIIWYDKAKNYRQFEFIWDPSKEPVNGGANAGVVGVPPSTPVGGSNSIFSSPGGQSGFGQTGAGGFGQSGTGGFGQQPGGPTTGDPGATGNPGPGQTQPQPQ